jgi:hypothetical protein
MKHVRWDMILILVILCGLGYCKGRSEYEASHHVGP